MNFSHIVQAAQPLFNRCCVDGKEKTNGVVGPVTGWPRSMAGQRCPPQRPGIFLFTSFLLPYSLSDASQHLGLWNRLRTCQNCGKPSHEHLRFSRNSGATPMSDTKSGPLSLELITKTMNELAREVGMMDPDDPNWEPYL